MSARATSRHRADREEMLAAIGVASVDDLFAQIPPGVRFERPLDVPAALAEAEIVRHLEELAARNADSSRELSFLGAGIYDHYVPAIVDTFLSRGEFLTAYTPYQPEMSQGVLQSIFEYQTAICELTGMDVSNAWYDRPPWPTRASSRRHDRPLGRSPLRDVTPRCGRSSRPTRRASASRSSRSRTTGA
jgi:glycine dehydrogenase subunit 1